MFSDEVPTVNTMYFFGFAIFLFAAFIFFTGIAAMQHSRALARRGEPVVGTIDRIEIIGGGSRRGIGKGGSYIHVRYYVDEQAFRVRLEEYRRGVHTVGMEVLLFYDPANPSNVTTGRMSNQFVAFTMYSTIGMFGGIFWIIKLRRSEYV